MAELWLQRNLAAGDDVDKIAKRRGLPKLRLFRRRAEAKRKAKLAQAMVGASEAKSSPGRRGGRGEDNQEEVDDGEEDNDENEDETEAGDDGTTTTMTTTMTRRRIKGGCQKARGEERGGSPIAAAAAAAQHRWHRAGIDALRSIGNGVVSVASVVPFVGTPGGEKRTHTGGGGDDSLEKTEDERRRDSALWPPRLSWRRRDRCQRRTARRGVGSRPPG